MNIENSNYEDIHISKAKIDDIKTDDIILSRLALGLGNESTLSDNINYIVNQVNGLLKVNDDACFNIVTINDLHVVNNTRIDGSDNYLGDINLLTDNDEIIIHNKQTDKYAIKQSSLGKTIINANKNEGIYFTLDNNNIDFASISITDNSINL